MKKSILFSIMLFISISGYSQLDKIDWNQVSDAVNDFANDRQGINQAGYNNLIGQAKATYKDRLITYSTLQEYKAADGRVCAYYPPAKVVFYMWLKDGKLNRNIVLVDEYCSDCSQKFPKAHLFSQWKQKYPAAGDVVSKYIAAHVAFNPEIEAYMKRESDAQKAKQQNLAKQDSMDVSMGIKPHSQWTTRDSAYYGNKDWHGKNPTTGANEYIIHNTEALTPAQAADRDSAEAARMNKEYLKTHKELLEENSNPK